jgi:DNA-binding protein HU-beta
MNKAELVTRVAQKTQMSKNMILGIAEEMIEQIETALKKGEKVHLVGFGAWQKKHRKPRLGRNPQTGKPLKIPARNVVTFQAGSQLISEVNN